MNNEVTWPELVYGVAEHFRWERQHLCKTVAEFKRAIRRHEVPLNHLFMILLRWSSPETICALLKPFGLDDDGQLGGLHLTAPCDAGYTQPDICIESKSSRLYIESKVGSKLDLKQVQKYLLLHAEMDSRGRKSPYLLILTPGEFVRHWKPHDAAANGDVHSFLCARTTEAPIENLANCVDRKTLARLASRYEEVKHSIRYGAATWKSIGARLAGLCSEYEGAGGREAERRVICDFITDLERRRLMA